MENYNATDSISSSQQLNNSNVVYTNDRLVFDSLKLEYIIFLILIFCLLKKRFIPNRALSNLELSHHLLHNITNTHSNKRPRVLNLHTRPAKHDFQQSDMITRKSSKRSVPANPERVLDAPELKDDFYLNLIDWSASNIIAAPLNNELYLWNETDHKTSLLLKTDPQDLNGYLASTAWMKIKGNISPS